MGIIEEVYAAVITTACQVCNANKEELFRSDKEQNVNARGMAIVKLVEYSFTDLHISSLTGLSRQAVNKIKNHFPSRIRHSWILTVHMRHISAELDPIYPPTNHKTDTH